jgi:NADPH2:quinone reductase
VIVVTRSGGPEGLELQEVAAPEPGYGELLVDVSFAGVNFRDIYERRGGYGPPPPVVAGIEGMGRVAAVAEGVTGAAVGDRVAWNNAQGSYAEQVVVPAARAVPVPAGSSTNSPVRPFSRHDRALPDDHHLRGGGW